MRAEPSAGLDKLRAVRDWVSDGISTTLDQPGGSFLLGIESASIIDALDYIEGYILNLEAERDAR